MSKLADKKTPRIIDGTSGEVIHTPPKIDLKSIDDVRLEMARCYRDMRSSKIPSAEGARLVYVLGQIGKMIELHVLEKRLEALEVKNETK